MALNLNTTHRSLSSLLGPKFCLRLNVCYISKSADDCYRSPECQQRIQPVPLIRHQGHEIVDSKFVRREHDHEAVISYNDINQLFWYWEGIARIVLNDKVGFTAM